MLMTSIACLKDWLFAWLPYECIGAACSDAGGTGEQWVAVCRGRPVRLRGNSAGHTSRYVTHGLVDVIRHKCT